MKRYRSAEWNFSLDVPKGWHSFPPVATNSPLEVIRFASKEDGTHLVIIFRGPRDPQRSLKEVSDQAEQKLVRQDFRNFVTTETTIGSRPALLLEFDRPWAIGSLTRWQRRWRRICPFKKPLSGGTWSCREYFLAEGSLQYTLGFGTTNKDGMFELFDRMAKSFEFRAD